jgi:hypothetical protein
MVRKEFLQVKLMANERNLGFAKANNQALQEIFNRGNASVEAEALPLLPDFVLLLNQDTQVLPDTLAGMVDFMRKHTQAGVAGCKLVDENGKVVPQVRRFPKFLDQAAVILKVPHIFPRVLDKYLMADFDYDKKKPQEVDSIRGSFFMIRREVLERTGNLDERYFFWFEEVDFCRQVKNAGWEVMYNGAVKCIDLVGQSVKKMFHFEGQKMFTESMLKYFKKWQPRWQYWFLWLLRPVGLGMALIADHLHIRRFA